MGREDGPDPVGARVSESGPLTRGSRLLVVGADAAGMSAAHQALRTAGSRGATLDVVVLERTPHTSYSACGIPYWVAGDVDSADRLSARSVDQHRQMGVDLRMGATAVHVDRDARTVSYVTSDGESVEPFDQLVLATGSPAVVPAWATRADGSLVPGVMPLKDLDDGAWWLERVGGPSDSRSRRRAVVAGGGYIGLEMAEAMVRRGWTTTLITRSTVMSSLDEDMSDRIRAAVESAGVTVLTGVAVEGLETGPSGQVTGVVTVDGQEHEADAVVLRCPCPRLCHRPPTLSGPGSASLPRGSRPLSAGPSPGSEAWTSDGHPGPARGAPRLRPASFSSRSSRTSPSSTVSS